MSIGIILGLFIFFGMPILKIISVLFMESINVIGKLIFIGLIIIAFFSVPYISIPIGLFIFFMKRSY